MSLTRTPLRRKTKRKPSRICFLFQKTPCPLEPLMSSVYKDIQSCFYYEFRGLWQSCQSQEPPPSSGALSFKPDGAAQPISPWPLMLLSGRGLEEGGPLSEQEVHKNLAFMSPATKAPPWAHWSQVGKSQEASKKKEQQVWIPIQALLRPFLIWRPHSASMS